MISVLGAGVAGLCAATALAERGLPVEVIGAATPPVSRLAGGMLAPFCEGADVSGGVSREASAALVPFRFFSFLSLAFS